MSTAESLPAATPKTRGPSPHKTARTRSLIVQAALDVFLECGYAQATMAGVAKKSGLAKGTAYHYFDSKEDLFEGVVQEVVVDPLFHAPLPELGMDEGLGAFFMRTLSPLMHRIEQSRRAAVMRLVMAEGRSFPKLVDIYRRKAFDPMIEQIRQAAEAALARGEQQAAVLARHPQLLMAPVWVGVINNSVLAPDSPVDIGALFDAQVLALLPAP